MAAINTGYRSPPLATERRRRGGAAAGQLLGRCLRLLLARHYLNAPKQRWTACWRPAAAARAAGREQEAPKAAGQRAAHDLHRLKEERKGKERRSAGRPLAEGRGPPLSQKSLLGGLLAQKAAMKAPFLQALHGMAVHPTQERHPEAVKEAHSPPPHR